MAGMGITLVALGATVGLVVISFAGSWKSLLLTTLLFSVAGVVTATTRHAQIVQWRKKTKWPVAGQKDTMIINRKQEQYFLFVLGSGGHTKEMLMMMDDGFCDFGRSHRRYLISSGDRMSENHLRDYEADLKRLCQIKNCAKGTYDVKVVTRARRVHQTIWTTPFTAFLSTIDILRALLSPPDNDTGRSLRYPTQVFSNGPATGFFVALAIHLLKILSVLTIRGTTFIYIESWARISTLSLTGKLLHRTGLADHFVVQHKDVANKYRVAYAGEMVFNCRRQEQS